MKINKKDLFDRQSIKIIIFIGALLGFILVVIQILDLIIPPKPSLELTPFQENNHLYLSIYNGGEKIAQIQNYTLCKPEGKNLICSQNQIFGEPKYLAYGNIITLDTNLSINTLKYYMNNFNEWKINLCEKTIKCKIYKFVGYPPSKIEIKDFVPPPPTPEPPNWGEILRNLNETN